MHINMLIDILKLFKELVMEYGFWNCVFATAFLILVFNITWKLPGIISAINELFK